MARCLHVFWGVAAVGTFSECPQMPAVYQHGNFYHRNYKAPTRCRAGALYLLPAYGRSGCLESWHRDSGSQVFSDRVGVTLAGWACTCPILRRMPLPVAAPVPALGVVQCVG